MKKIRLWRTTAFLTCAVWQAGAQPLPVVSDSLYLQGRACEERLDFGRARACYAALLARDSSAAAIPVMMSLSGAAEGEGDFRNARRWLEKVLTLDSAHVGARFALAALCYRSEAYADALERYRELWAADTLNRMLRIRTGDCLVRLGKSAEGVSCYERALEAYPRDLTTAKKLIALWAAAGERPALQEGLRVCERALKHAPDDSALLRAKANILFRLDDYAAAETVFETLLEGGNDTTRNDLLTLGLLKNKRQFYREAIPLLEAACRQDTTDMASLLGLAAAYGGARDSVRAFACLNRAERVYDVTRTALLRARGDIFRDHRASDSAARYYYEAYRIDPTRLDALSEMIYLYPYRMEKQREKGLFALVTYIEAGRKAGYDFRKMPLLGELLSRYDEQLFFEAKGYLPMRDPYGRTYRLSAERMKRLMGYFGLGETAPSPDNAG